MSEDVANKVPQTDDEKLTLILSTVLSLTARVDNVDLRLSRVEQTVDDTRSVLQEVRADILKLHEGQRAVSTDVRALRRDMDNRSGVIYGMLSEIQSDDRDLHERVTRLELYANTPNSQT